MPRDWRLYVDDILEAIGRIREYVAGYDGDAFAADRKTQDAVVRNLEIIGEASRRLPEEVLALAPEVEWRKIVGLQSVLAHEYFGINASIVWDIVVNKLGPLERACRTIMDRLDGEAR